MFTWEDFAFEPCLKKKGADKKDLLKQIDYPLNVAFLQATIKTPVENQLIGEPMIYALRFSFGQTSAGILYQLK